MLGKVGGGAGNGAGEGIQQPPTCVVVGGWTEAGLVGVG